MEEELKNAQARINILSSVVVELAGLLAQNQPDYIREQMGQIMKVWSKAEDENPMSVD